MQAEISASILSANTANLGAEVAAMVEANISSIHFDVMDMSYVPNLTFGPIILENIQSYLQGTPVNVHLMVNSTNALIPLFAKSGASCLMFHPETVPQPLETIKLIKQHGCKVGIAINPNEPVNMVMPFINLIDRVLLMSVFPGFAGQEFIAESISRIKELHQLCQQQNAQCIIEVDGGIKLDNCAKIIQSGANSIVVGSGLFSLGDDYKSNLKKFTKKLIDLDIYAKKP